MKNELNQQIAAVRKAQELGCFGAHKLPNGEWMPCSSSKQFLVATNEIKSRMSLEDVQRWSSARKAKGKKRKKRWDKLRERRMLGIDSIPGVGLVSSNSPTSANAISGGTIPPMTNSPSGPSGMSTKSIQPAYMPRDNDPDVFIDIESARKRSRQLGCIGVSRRMSKGGKTVWMPCTNISDYNNLTGMTALGRLNQGKKRNTVVRTIVREELKRRKKSIPEELLGKSLGPKLRSTARFVSSRFDPKAIDGDEDGLIQDGTAFERPNIPTPNVPKNNVTNTPKESTPKEPTPKEIDSIKKWMSKLTAAEKDNFAGEPIDAYEGPDSNVGGLASRGGRGVTVVGQRRGPPRMTKPQKTVTIDGLDNPEASPTNPFKNLGGKTMGKIIRDMVKPENKGKSQPTTYIVGGNTGSGKNTVLEGHLVPKGLVPSSSEAATIDPDFIKKGLPGYDDGQGAGKVHGQSQVVTDKIIKDSSSEGIDMVLMGAGASRQIGHMRQAKARGELVSGHWVHVPQRVAAKRIRKRMEETGRYIPDNTSHLATSIPRAISSAFDEDLLDEFYLWDNDIPDGSAPRLIAQKIRGEKFEIFDNKKFEEFAGDKKWADKWVSASEKNDSLPTGLASASKNKKKKGGRYTPPQKRPSGAIGVAPPFSTTPGTGVKTSMKNIPGIDKEVDKLVNNFVAQITKRMTEDNKGNPKDPVVYLQKKAKHLIRLVLYSSTSNKTGDALKISDLSLRKKFKIPQDIDKILDIYVPMQNPNESLENFITRIADTIPALQFSTAYSHPNYAQFFAQELKQLGYSDAGQQQVRDVLREELLNNKSFSAFAQVFGMPMFINADSMGPGVAAFHSPTLGIVAINKKTLAKGGSEAIGSSIDKRKFDTVGETLRHEWFHYLDAMLVSAYQTNRNQRLSSYVEGLTELYVYPEKRVRRVLGTNEEMIEKLESRMLDGHIMQLMEVANYSYERARKLAQKSLNERLQDRAMFLQVYLKQDLARVFFDDLMEDLLTDRGGKYDDIASNYSDYARYAMHELFAEVGKMITSRPAERERIDTNINTIDSSTVDFLVDFVPDVPRGTWLSILRRAFPGVYIKGLNQYNDDI